MARVTDELLPHESDGIQEYDNPLPRWWLWMFYGCIVWAFAYMIYYHGMTDWSSAQRYDNEMAAALEKYGEPDLKPAVADLGAAVKEPERVARGKEIWMTYCASCHKPDGSGLVGPDMTDDEWLHGYETEQILETITKGVMSKGMVAWGPALGPEKCLDATAFVISLGGVEKARASGKPGVDPNADHSDHETHGAEAGSAPSGGPPPPPPPQ